MATMQALLDSEESPIQASLDNVSDIHSCLA
jgi:hypothetical protein